jgi:hypothetical protein
MGLVLDILDDIRAEIAVDDAALKETKDRRDLVAKGAMQIEGALRWFRSGSVAHGTTNAPISDADAGIVLDRRSYPSLGPDGEGEGPQDVVDAIGELVRPVVREIYPKARVGRSRRGLCVTFSDPIDDDQDPSVDMIVTLTRKDADGLWIPDLDKNTDDDWSASHPEKHTDLFTSGSKEVKRLRARVARLAKAWNKQWDKPALSSFNIEALCWEYIQDGSVPLDEALVGWFAYARDEIEDGLTPDPAGVSEDLKLLIPKADVLVRLKAASERLEEAIENDGDEDKVRDILSGVFRDYVEPAEQSRSAWAAALRKGNQGVGSSGSGLVIGAGSPMKTPRSFGAGGRNG